MLRFSFKKGLTFIRSSINWRIIRRLPDKRLQLESEEGELWTSRETEIISLLEQGTVSVDSGVSTSIDIGRPMVSRDFATYPIRNQEQARYRMKYVSALLERNITKTSPKYLDPIVTEVAKQMQDNNPPSGTTVYRWVRRYQKGSSINNLLSKKENCGRRGGWAPEVETVFDEAIDSVFLNQQRHPRKAIIERMHRKLAENGHLHLLPSQASIYRHLKQFEAYDVLFEREGKAAAQKTFRTVVGIQRAAEILERVEIDHTPLNIIVFCEQGKRGNGRPWLTAAIDKHSRLVVGYYISFRSPSAYAVLQCLRQIILPKDGLLASYPDITTAWPARGIPSVIVCDNGMELHSNAFSQACLELGIQIQFCPAKKPQYKGSIERFLKTINHDLIHQLPGTVFSNPKERGDYPSEKLSCITFETLNHQVLKWIVEVYNATPHRGIRGLTPLEKWQAGEQRVILEYPSEPAKLDVIIGQPATRRVFHYGVEVNSLYYNNEELQHLRQRHGTELHVDLKFHEDELGYVHIFDPDRKAYFSVNAIDQDYAPGMTLHMHEIIREKGRQNSKDSQRRFDLLQKKEELQQLVAKAIKDKKMARRKRAAVLKGVDTSESTLRVHSQPQVEIVAHDENKDDKASLAKLVIRKRRLPVDQEGNHA